MRRSNFFVQGRTPKDVWYRGLKLIMSRGAHVLDERGSNTKEILNLMTRIEEPRGNFPEEILKRERMLIEYEDQFLSPENKGFSYTYGERLRNWEGIDQIQVIIERIRNTKNTRRATATTWIPAIDSKREEVPCMILVDFKLREKLELTALFRSHDFYGAYPYNIYALSKLQEYAAREIKAKPGGITVLSISAHIYAGDLQSICSILGEPL
ncbi:MAG: Putative thymidylate synthase [Candidatus Methanolliviera sp. GoM_asphalt]|nr:MAG: Putative thymidylate synthase [Candidatus Methanolliviera sp. GoM_asphalt]